MHSSHHVARACPYASRTWRPTSEKPETASDSGNRRVRGPEAEIGSNEKRGSTRAQIVALSPSEVGSITARTRGGQREALALSGARCHTRRPARPPDTCHHLLEVWHCAEQHLHD